MCEVDFRAGAPCTFGPAQPDAADNMITTDPFGIDPDRCVNWQRCLKGIY
jgi:hypothetical protein